MLNTQATTISVLLDTNQSIKSGSSLMESSFTIYKHLDEAIFPTKIVYNKTKFSPLINSMYRLTKLAGLDLPMIHFFPIIQHEYYGHANLCRRTGNDFSYNIGTPSWGGLPSAGCKNYNNISNDQSALFSSLGVEASSILADNIRKNIFQNKTLHYKNAIFYILSNNDLYGYTLFTDTNFFSTIAVADISSYLMKLDSNYDISLDSLKNYSLLGLFLDPLNYYSFYSIGNYIITGQKNINIPFFDISKSISILPMFSFRLAPFGPELGYQLYINNKKSLSEIAMYHSHQGINTSWALEFSNWNKKINNNIKLDTHLYLWNQPTIQFKNNSNTIYNKKGLGFGVDTICHIKVNKNSTTHILISLGYKTDGYLPGEALYSDISFKIGSTFSF